MRTRSLVTIVIVVVLVLVTAFTMRGRGHAFMRHLGVAIHGR
jgi:predicted small secreted protein